MTRKGRTLAAGIALLLAFGFPVIADEEAISLYCHYPDNAHVEYHVAQGDYTSIWNVCNSVSGCRYDYGGGTCEIPGGCTDNESIDPGGPSGFTVGHEIIDSSGSSGTAYHTQAYCF
jgi:hypothetical protein